MAFITPYYNFLEQNRKVQPAAGGSVSGEPSSTEGFLSDLDSDKVISGITGGLGLAANVYGMANQSSGVSTQSPDLQYSATGEPVYTGGDFYNQASLSTPQKTSGGELLSGFTQGASAGSALGFPGVIGGGLVGLLSTAFGGGRRRRKQEREIRRARQSARRTQKDFNRASVAYDKQQASEAEYHDNLDMTERFQNLYNLYR